MCIRGRYFYFEKGHDGKLPTNWRSYFGGPVWEPVPGYDELYYLHVFHKGQPDLNWENPELRQELYKMINWWLDKGIADFIGDDGHFSSQFEFDHVTVEKKLRNAESVL